MGRFTFHGTRKPDFTKIRKIDYDEYWQERGFEMRTKLMERELIFFDWIKSHSKVLDVGCGSSRLLYELKEKKGCNVTGMDISPLVVASLEQAGIPASVGNLDSSDFQITGNYDYIIVNETIEHLSQPEELMSKIKSHARQIVISGLNSAFYRYRFGLFFKGRFFTQWMSHPSEHLRFWSHSDFKDWLQALGFEIIKYESSTGFQFMNVWPNLFGHQICYLIKPKE